MERKGGPPMSRENGSRGKRPEVRPVDRRTGRDRRRGDGIESGSDFETPESSAAVAPPKPQIVLKPIQLFNVLSSVIDKLHRGALVIDGSGWVHVRNVAASAMAAAGDAFRIANGRLQLRSADQQRLLEQYLSAAETEPALALKVARMGKNPPYRMLVSSLPLVDVSNPKLSMFAVFVYQPDAGRQIPTMVLRELYGLTPAEARLVICLFHGDSMSTASASLGIATTTARSHLKHVFNKCEVRSQAELMQLLSLGPRTY
jgi:DNA-binding CsgD family transcriptional regulator